MFKLILSLIILSSVSMASEKLDCTVFGLVEHNGTCTTIEAIDNETIEQDCIDRILVEHESPTEYQVDEAIELCSQQ